MKTIWVVLAAGGLCLAGCGGGEGGGDDGAGACLESGSGYQWCHNFHDDSKETGEQICKRVGGTFNKGKTCVDMGYTRSCPDGSYAKGSCI